VTNPKNGQILQNGQMRIFMASAVKNMANLATLDWTSSGTLAVLPLTKIKNHKNQR